MSHHFSRLSVALVLGAAAFGCSSHKEEAPAASAPEPVRTTGAERNEPTAPAIEEPAQPGSTEPSEREANTAGMGEGSPATPVSDAQIVRILTTINGAEVEQAQVAKQQSQDPRVKKFAEQMIQDHGKANDRTTRLYKQQELMPANSSVANELQDKSTQVLTALNSAEGPSFDKIYIDAQVQQHQQALDLLDSRLIPSAEHPQLKAELEQDRDMIARHLQKAREIQAQTQR